MKKTHIAALLVIAIAIVGILSISSDYSSYATFEKASDYPEQEFRVIGYLNEAKEMSYDPEKDPNYFEFQLIDKDGREEKVVFYGAKPRDFDRSEEVVLTGNMDKEQFTASKILLKCPSKYVEDEIEIQEFNATKQT